MADDERVDPRYDAAFQRGYSGAGRTSAPAARASRPERTSDDPREPLMPRAPRDAAAAVAATGDDLPRRPVLRDLAANPFVVALTAIGILLIVAGIALANQGRALAAVRGQLSSELDYWFLEATVVAAPLALLAGVGILAGVLFLAAAAWNRRL